MRRQSIITIKKGLLILGLVFFLGTSICLMEDAEKLLAASHLQGASLFPEYRENGEGVLWEPGMEKGGVWVFKNPYSQSVRLCGIWLTLELEMLQDGVYQKVTNPALFELFARKMRLQIVHKQSGVAGDIPGEVICEQSFYDLLAEGKNSSQHGFTLPSSKKISIGEGDALNLQYHVKMAEEADNRLQGLKATAVFQVKVEGDDVVKSRARKRRNQTSDLAKLEIHNIFCSFFQPIKLFTYLATINKAVVPFGRIRAVALINSYYQLLIHIIE